MMKHKKKMLGLQLFMFMGILVMLYYGFSTADSGLSREDAQRAKEAIQKAALECYSIEGAYPQSLEYLKQHYGLIYRRMPIASAIITSGQISCRIRMCIQGVSSHETTTFH